MPLRTTLCSTAVPSRCSVRLHLPGGATPNHELFVDMDGKMNHHPLVVPVHPEDPGFILSIRDAIVRSKKPGGTPIDAIHIACCTAGLPDHRIWEALEEAEPSHLELSTTELHRQCNYGGLGMVDLKPGAWQLKSMYLDGDFGAGDWLEDEKDPTKQPPSFPACYAGLETLVLDCPDQDSDSIYFYPAGGATNLRSLTIIGFMSAVQAFANTVDCNPKIAETLRSLTITCTIVDLDKGWQGGIRRMKRFLKEEARELETIELIVEDVQTTPVEEEYGSEDMMLGLAECLPNTVTTFSFLGPANARTLKDMDNWIEKARGSSWLPELKKIGFELTLPWWSPAKNVTGKNNPTIKPWEEKVKMFLNSLKQRQPPVEIIEPRNRMEVAYPVAT